MTEPEIQPAKPTDTVPHQRPMVRWWIFVVLLGILPFFAYRSVVGIIKHVDKVSYESYQWRSSYEALITNQNEPDRVLSTFLKDHLNRFYKEKGRYPDNSEGLSFINVEEWNANNPVFDPNAPPPVESLQATDPEFERIRRIIEQQGRAILSQNSTLSIIGPVAFLSPIAINSSNKSFVANGFDTAYVYVNKMDLNNNLLADFKDYENTEQTSLNFVDNDIFIYSTDLVNAYRYNQAFLKTKNWNNLWIPIMWLIPLITFLLTLWILIKSLRLIKSHPMRKEKRQLITASVIAGIGIVLFAIVRFYPGERVTCYAMSFRGLPTETPLGYFRQVLEGKDYRKEKLGDLLNKFQERGIIQKDTADKIRQGGSTTSNR